MENKVVIFCDGGSRGNPGPAACAFVVQSKDGKIVYQANKFLGVATNNFAEYSAVILALEWAGKKRFTRIKFNLDSQLVVSQLNGVYKVKSPSIQELFLITKKLLKNISGKITFEFIPREKNCQADLLVNQVLDEN